MKAVAMVRDPLSDFRVVLGCPASWRAMKGDDRVRHCTDCDRKVYNLSDMTREEALTLLMGSEGRVCARYYRRPDGTIMTRDCGRQEQTRARVATAIGAAAVAVLSTLGLGMVFGPRFLSQETVGVMPAAQSPPHPAHEAGEGAGDPAMTEIVGETAVAPDGVAEIRQEIAFLNERIRLADDPQTRRGYANERQALVDNLRQARAEAGQRP